MKRTLLFLILLLNFNFFVSAQDEEEKTPFLDISGSADAYFRANLNADYDLAPGTSFANLPGFSLGMANLVLGKEGEKVGFTADLVVGPRGEDATFLSPVLRPGGNSSIVNQLYVYWNISDKVTATMGNFNTFLGYEVISPAANYNYSTSYMFSYGPFSHTGLKVDVGLTDDLSLMLGVFNPTDATEYNPLNEYTLGAQLGYSLENGSVYLNALSDPGDFFQIDLTAGFDVSDDIYLGINSTYATDLFFGLAGYFQYGISDELSVGTRLEYFSDQGLGLVAEDDAIIDLTLSANYQVGKLKFIPEFRVDLFSSDIQLREAVFNDNGTIDDAVTGKALASFVLGAVYEF